MRVLFALATVLLAAWSPLLFPGGWVRDGFVPDLGVLVVTYVALRVGPDRAALVGMAIGLAASPFSAEPIGVQVLLLGGLGYGLGMADRALYRDRAVVQLGLAALGVVAVRVGGRVLTAALLPVDVVLGSGGAARESVGGLSDWPAALIAVGTAALTTAIVAPAAFRLLRVTRMLGPLEPRAPTGDSRRRARRRV